jgi:CDGSH-type Zn-finger protein
MPHRVPWGAAADGGVRGGGMEREEVEIHVRPDGSYKVYGPVVVRDVDGNPYDLAAETTMDGLGARIKLCRCGASATMPFCDESHVATGFVSSPRVP